MYELKVTHHFAAAHNLREFHGACENLHGHNWFVEAVVRVPGLENNGLALDFGVIKKRLKEVLELLDHKYLNEMPEFVKTNPSSENIAVFIYERLAPHVAAESDGRAILYSVTAWESDNACAAYIAD
ncbi:MAG: 6-carboxytetrahydropterin synthase QueD [Deltaproteobacteria bacterium]|jgi:6-pyruvoyltetrahydropterin/6-carboxytetrahydropterin synthase|nr:6-carboxytetrahydropterin synthase QueD [Deltaproteobacteria bacterium]